MPDDLTPDSFLASPDATAPPPLTPDSFMQLQPENLPSREAFEASHQAAVASWWDKAKALTETAAPLVFHKSQELMNAPLVPESVMPAPAATPAGAVARSTLEFARGMTSPENIGLAALMGPLSKIAPLLSRT